MTILDRLKILASKIQFAFDEVQLANLLKAHGLNAAEEWTADADPKIWLTYADMLEIFVSAIDYKQGEISEEIDRQALLELAHEIRMRYVPASKSEIYYAEEVGNTEW